MNPTLFLAQKILVVLGESNHTLESQLAASEIVKHPLYPGMESGITSHIWTLRDLLAT